MPRIDNVGWTHTPSIPLYKQIRPSSKVSVSNTYLAEHSPRVAWERGLSPGCTETSVPPKEVSPGSWKGSDPPAATPLLQAQTALAFLVVWWSLAYHAVVVPDLRGLCPLSLSPLMCFSTRGLSQGALLLEGASGIRVNVLGLFQSPTVPL